MKSLSEIINIEEGESDRVDFKESFNKSQIAWLDIIKDIVAMANSGGGIIVFGIDDEGYSTDFNGKDMLEIDPASITDKIFSFTGVHFSKFKIYGTSHESNIIAVIEIGLTPIPIVFSHPGNYQHQGERQKSVFGIGSLYFRHGAKSEPCTSEDLSNFLNREINRTKESWLSGIRQVVEAPNDSRILVVPISSVNQSVETQPIRIVDDPSAPVLRIDEKEYFELYPFGYHELIEALQNRYSDFLQNAKFHAIRRPLLENPRYCKIRVLNPHKAKSQKLVLYSKYVFEEFDKHYKVSRPTI